MKTNYSKKICFISHGLSGGGMERALTSLANIFCEQGHKVSIINLYKTEIFFDINPKINIVWPVMQRNNRLFNILGLIPFIRKEIKKDKPDVVLSFGEAFSSYVVIATRFLGVRLIITNRMGPKLKLGFPIDLANWLLYRFADGVIAQTNIAKTIISKRSPNNNIVVIPNAIKPIDIEIKERKKQIVNVGRLSEAKGHIYLIKAFAQLPENEWTLHLVGDGPKRQYIEDEVKRLNLTDKVTFYGHLKDFINILAESEIFVLPSIFEGFPNALVEAMSVPLACISSNCVAGPSDIIKDGKNGMLFETGNVDQLSQKLWVLMEDSSMRESLSKEAFKVRREYEFNRIADLYLKFLVNE